MSIDSGSELIIDLGRGGSFNVDVRTGITGPPGLMGPEGPAGTPGTTTIIVGSFGNVRTPDELPESGFIPANWDGPGNPANDYQMAVGNSVVHIPDGRLWTFVNFTAGAVVAWLDVGQVQGPPGDRGPIGERGPEGPQGSTGPPGPTGSQGPTGQTGSQGPPGAQGIPGGTGDRGPQGVPGDMGPIGPPGDIGPQGETGPEGPQGPQGDVGPEGPQGPPGDIGPQGDTGPEGVAGPQGPVGDRGATGDPGPAGQPGDPGALADRRALMWQTQQQTINSGAFGLLIFNEKDDPLGDAVNSSIYVARADGLYLICGTCHFAAPVAGATSMVLLTVYRNSTEYRRGAVVSATGPDESLSVTVSTLMYMRNGQQASLRLLHVTNPLGTLTTGGSDATCWFSIQQLTQGGTLPANVGEVEALNLETFMADIPAPNGIAV